MSQYTIVNFIPNVGSTKDWKDFFEYTSRSRFIRQDDTVIVIRFGGYKKEKVYNRMVSSENGYLLYDIYNVGSFDPDEFIGHLIISHFEDTGDTFESDLYKIYAYGEAEKIDSVTVYGEGTPTNQKLTEYYETEFDLFTSVQPP